MEIRFYHWPVALLAAMTTHAALMTGYPEDARPVERIPRAGASTLNISVGPPGQAAPGLQDETGAQPRETEVAASQEPSAAEPTAADITPQTADTEPTAMAVAGENRASRREERNPEAGARQPRQEVGPNRPAIAPRSLPRADELWAASTTMNNPVFASEPGRRLAQAAPLSGAIAGGANGQQGVSRAGKSRAADSGGLQGELATGYLAELQAWLARHKQYPRFAQQRRQEGRVLLYFRIDRDGNVMEQRVEQGSGYELLDRAAENMLRRAEPLPSMPEHMAQTELELTLPVQFELR